MNFRANILCCGVAKRIMSFITLIISVSSHNTFANEIIVYTEDQPPLNFYSTVENKMSGFATDIVQEILQRIGSDAQIQRRSWATAYSLVEKGDAENMFLYSMGKTLIRADKFKWVGPIAAKNTYLFAKKGSDIRISTLDEAKSYNAIGTKRGDSKEQFLKARGVTNITRSATWDLALKNFMNGRYDLIVYTDLDFPILAKRVRVDMDKIKAVMELYRYPIYIGVSKSTSYKVVKKWQDALDAIKEDGTFALKVKQWSELHNANWVYKDGMLQSGDKIELQEY